jgi:hypothetical protein
MAHVSILNPVYFNLKAFSAFSLSFEIEEASFSLPEPSRLTLNVGFFFDKEAANNLSISGL